MALPNQVFQDRQSERLELWARPTPPPAYADRVEVYYQLTRFFTSVFRARCLAEMWGPVSDQSVILATVPQLVHAHFRQPCEPSVGPLPQWWHAGLFSPELIKFSSSFLDLQPVLCRAHVKKTFMDVVNAHQDTLKPFVPYAFRDQREPLTAHVCRAQLRQQGLVKEDEPEQALFMQLLTNKCYNHPVISSVAHEKAAPWLRCLLSTHCFPGIDQSLSKLVSEYVTDMSAGFPAFFLSFEECVNVFQVTQLTPELLSLRA